MSRTHRRIPYAKKYGIICRTPKIVRNLRREYASVGHLRDHVRSDKCKYNHSVGSLLIYDDREIPVSSDKETPKIKTPFLIPGKSTKDICTKRIGVREKNNYLQVITKDDIPKGTRIGSITLMYYADWMADQYMVLRIGGCKLRPYTSDRRSPLVLISSVEKGKHANVIFTLEHRSHWAVLRIHAKRHIRKNELLMAKYDHGQWEINT